MANEVRLIDYDAAIDRYYAEYEKQDICCGGQDRDWLKKCFDEAPTIDPESLRPKGRWVMKETMIRSPFAKNAYCSECLEETAMNYNYCPNCGRKMEG